LIIKSFVAVLNRAALAIVMAVLSLTFTLPVAGSASASEVSNFVYSPVSAASGTTCAIRQGDLVYCVGKNAFGQLGNGAKNSTSEPSQVLGLPKALSLSIGNTSACAIATNFNIWCWGDNSNGQLSVSTQQISSYVALDTGLTNATDISVGSGFACAIRTAQVWCWGDNSWGQLGHTGANAAQVELPTTAIEVSAGSNFACALLSDKSVFCWGANDVGQLGRASNSPTGAAAASLIQGATSISAGSNSACAVLANSTVSCWGSNSNGQLGNASLVDSPSPVVASGLSGATQVEVGTSFACAILASNAVYCWGKNDHGQLGIGTTVDSNIRVPSKLKLAAFLAAGATHLCALSTVGDISCVGSDDNGEWGSVASSANPLKANVSQVSAISAGTDESCAIRAPNGSLSCFGSFDAQLDQVTNVSQVDVGDESACYVRTDHTVWCFGANNGGELGDGTLTDQSTPVQVAGLSNIIQVAVGYRHACAVSSDGLAYCWGSNTKGQLGTADTKDYRTPQAVVGLVNAAGISAGHWHTCAWLNDGSDFCFGDNSKTQVGSNNLRNITSMSLSDFGTCALKVDRSVSCWGLNTDLQSPANASVSNALAIYSAGNQNCALIQDGTAKCWGKSLVSAAAVGSSSQLALGFGFVCGLSNSSMLCLGTNSTGQLGSSFGFKALATPEIPALTGDLKVGTSLSVSNLGDIPGSALSYEWLRSAQVVTVAVDSEFPLTSVDFNRTIAARIHRTFWHMVTISYPTTASIKVLAGDLPQDLQIQTSGLAVVDQTIGLAMAPLPADASVVYRWTQAGKQGSHTGAPNSFRASDVGAVYTVVATVNSPGYTSKDYTLPLPAISAGTQMNSTPVVISGKYKVGATLISRSLGWMSGSKISYQWLRNKASIKGATKQSYKLVAADANAKLSCRVSVSKLGYKPANATSAQTVKIVK
jgi:alpha-tubulin suppressor-like RCC1 family protein